MGERSRKVNTIIWDLDGTLMDTLQDLYLAVNHALSINGMAERTFEEVRCFVGNGVRRLMELAVPEDTDAEVFEKTFADFKAFYVEHCQDNTCLYEGIAETLCELKAMGLRMAVVSNKLQQGVTELFHSEVRCAGTETTIRLDDYIEVAIGERPGTARKPAADMVDIALHELGIGKENAVYIGDSDVDLATAQNSCLPCISVLWGFRDKEFLLEHGAKTFAQKPQDIISLI